MANISHITNSTSYKLNNLLINQKPQRPYLGASSIGKECARQLWYGFHWTSERLPISGRTKRIFDMGHIAESLITDHLARIGVKVWADQEEVTGFFGHALGHIDGRAIGFPEFPDLECLAEFKSAKASYFKEMFEIGCFRSTPVYYDQQQYYMGKTKLTKSFFCMINKDTSNIYIEFIDFDKGYYEDLLRKERGIITSEKPPHKHFVSDYYKCEWCVHNDVCHNSYEPQKNCRTCAHSDIEEEGKWSCNLKKTKSRNLPVAEQRTGCDKWRKGWEL